MDFLEQSLKARLDLALHVNRYLNESIRLADGKAGLLLGAHTGLILWLAVQLVSAVGERSFTGYAPLGFHLAAVSMLAVGYGASLTVVFPRLLNSDKRGLIFWDAIRNHGTITVFQQAVDNLDSEGVVRTVLTHNWDLATIAHQKYRALQRSFRWFSLGAGCALIGILLSATLMFLQQ